MMMIIPNSSKKLSGLLSARTTKKLALSSFALLLACGARASFTLIDDFDGYLAGSEVGGQGAWTEEGGSVDTYTVVDTGGNHVMAIANNQSGRGLLNASSSIDVSVANTGTLYFTISFENATSDQSMFDYGLQVTGTTNAGGINTRGAASIVNTQANGQLRIIGSNSTNVDLATTYEYWIVADNVNRTQSHYFRELGEVTAPIAIATAAAYQGSSATGSLTEFYLRTSSAGTNVTYLDNLYIDATAENLASPIAIPEPATVSLIVAVMVMGYVTYRRRRS